MQCKHGNGGGAITGADGGQVLTEVGCFEEFLRDRAWALAMRITQ